MSILTHDVLVATSDRHPGGHPSWCDPRACSSTEWDDDGTQLVTHAARLLATDSLTVDVKRADVVTPASTVEEQGAAFVETAGVDGAELTPEQAVALAGAIAAAAGFANGSFTGGVS